ncbi:MAG: Uma2 family endonuclease [Deltaproteobacteria bacterium]|nr:Uma2 family endonuclease [Deltaproteobacteria bacterium]
MSDAASSLHPMSVEQWAALDEDEPGELVDGHLEEEEVPTWAHELVVSWLIRVLGGWFVPRGGFVLGSESKVAVSARRGRKPDVVVFFTSRGLPPRQSSLTRSPPDVVIEVVTATPRDQRRDRVEKKADYAAFGVAQYWIVDPEARTFEILARRDDGRFVELLAASEGAHDVPSCDGLRLDLDALWSELERWPAGEDD